MVTADAVFGDLPVVDECIIGQGRDAFVRQVADGDDVEVIDIEVSVGGPLMRGAAPTAFGGAAELFADGELRIAAAMGVEHHRERLGCGPVAG